MRARIKCALFIDFENVAVRVAPEPLAALLAWLEDGCFDPAVRPRRRRLVHKRIYWNSSAEAHRPTFASAGFEVIRCDKYAALKNGADIRMALDIAEICLLEPRVEEFILITRDADFVPVLERLKLKGRRSAILADEHRPAIYTTLIKNTDIAIPHRRMSEAFAYVRPKRRFFGLFGVAGPRTEASPAPPANGVTARPGKALTGNMPAHGSSATAGRRAGRDAAETRHADGTGLLRHTPPAGPKVGPGLSSPRADSDRAQSQRAAAKDTAATSGIRAQLPDQMDAAADAVLALARANPEFAVGRKKINAALSRVAGFSTTGANAYFGLGSYRTMMIEIGRRTPQIRIELYKPAGLSVHHQPSPATPTDGSTEVQATPGPSLEASPDVAPTDKSNAGSEAAPPPASGKPQDGEHKHGELGAGEARGKEPEDDSQWRKSALSVPTAVVPVAS